MSLFTTRRRQYQVKTEPVWVPAAALVATFLSVAVPVVRDFQYQVKAEPVLVPPQENITVDKWVYPLSEPVRQRIGLGTHLQQLATNSLVQPEVVTVDKWVYPWTKPVRQRIFQTCQQKFYFAPEAVPIAGPGSGVGGVPSTVSASVQYESRTQYQALASPVFVPAAAAATGGIPSAVNVNIQYKTRIQYQSIAQPLFVGEIITVDKWNYAWSEPVRQRPGLRAHLQQAAIGPVLNPDTQITQGYESRWHQPWSEPVRLRRFPTAEQQALIFQPPSFEIITYDKWGYAWSEPVRQKQVLRTGLYQAFIATPLPNDLITPVAVRRQQPWSEPVRVRQFHVSLQQGFFFSPNPIPTTAPSGGIPSTVSVGVQYERRTQYQAIAQPVFVPPAAAPSGGIPSAVNVNIQYKARIQYQSIARPVFVGETVTIDKWNYAWSEPIKQKQGLRAHLQQAAIGPVLNPETQLIQGFESRWHYAWSEPVRLRRFPTAEQQAIAFQPPSFEVITYDKWGFEWSQPVRQQIGLKTHLQQALIATTLDPDTQITQGFESRWHYAWSEPVRQKLGLGAHLQQSLTPSVLFVTELVTVDKWFAQLNDPVRIKRGLLASEQQFFAADTTVIPTSQLEPWFAPLSEPVRIKRGLLASEQQFFTADLTVIPTSKVWWIPPLSEPVRLKIGLPSYLQQFFTTDPAVIPASQLIPWFAPLNEPGKPKRLLTAQQQAVAYTTFIPEVITVDKWIYPLTEPVKQKIGLKANLQQAFIGLTLDPDTQISQNFESRWHYAWSEPVRFRRFPAAHQQPFTNPPTAVFELVTEDKWHFPWAEPVRFRIDPKRAIALAAPFAAGPVLNPETQIIQGYESRWHYPWSEPVRLKVGLRAHLHPFTTPQTPLFPNLFKTIPYFIPLNEPVMVKRWIHPSRIPYFWTTPEAILTDVFVTLSGTEVNADSAIFGIYVYNAAVRCDVSIEEIPFIRTAAVSTEEVAAIRTGAVSVEELPIPNSGAVSVEEKPDSTGAVSIEET